MQFNEFNRRLEQCHVDQETKFLMMHLFEVQAEFSKALDLTLTFMTQLADKMHDVTLINTDLFEKVKTLQRHDAEVRSVLDTEN